MYWNCIKVLWGQSSEDLMRWNHRTGWGLAVTRTLGIQVVTRTHYSQTCKQDSLWVHFPYLRTCRPYVLHPQTRLHMLLCYRIVSKLGIATYAIFWQLIKAVFDGFHGWHTQYLQKLKSNPSVGCDAETPRLWEYRIYSTVMGTFFFYQKQKLKITPMLQLNIMQRKSYTILHLLYTV